MLRTLGLRQVTYLSGKASLVALSKRNLLRAVSIGAGIALVSVGMTAPAYASGNVDSISYRSFIHTYLNVSGGDGTNMTITEAADASSVTITDTTAASFSIQAPCQQTASDTVVCPTLKAAGVNIVAVTLGSLGGSVTVDTPTLSVASEPSAPLSNNGLALSVPHSGTDSVIRPTITFGNGNDTFHGGTGAMTVSLNGGTDFADVSDSPAQQDIVNCGAAPQESPSDTVVVDSADAITNSWQCLSIVGPWNGTPAAPGPLMGGASGPSLPPVISLSWQDNSLIEQGFQIERCKGVGCTNFSQITTNPSNVTSIEDHALSLNTSYSYRVRAFNGALESAYSNTLTIKTAAH